MLEGCDSARSAMQDVLEARKASEQRDADSLAIQTAANKLDLEQLQSNNTALQVTLTSLTSPVPAADCGSWQP